MIYTIQARRELFSPAKIIHFMKELYPRQLLPKDVSDWYENSLRGVIRFKDPVLPPIDPNFQENDLTHTIQTIDLAREFAVNCPDIAAFLGEENLKKLELMLYLHEAGEPIAGDMPINIADLRIMKNGAGKFAHYLMNKFPEDLEPDKKFSLLRVKLARREHKIFSYIVLPCFPEDLQPIIRELYYRFEEPSDNDLVAQLSNFFDKHDGNRTSLVHFMDKNNNPRYNPLIHAQSVENGLKRTLKYAKNLNGNLPLDLAESWVSHLVSLLSIYEQYGYGDLANLHLNYFKDSLKTSKLGLEKK